MTDVFLAALVTAVATGAGALPLLIAGSRTVRWLRGATALAAGAMLLVGALLLVQGWREGPFKAAAGVIAGVLFVQFAGRLLQRRHAVHFEALRGAPARKALLLVGVMTVHSFAEGIGVGVSFGASETVGFATAAAIAVHNVPEGLAISLVLVPRGISVLHAAGWSIFSSLPQPLMAVPAFAFVTTFDGVLPLGLGFAAGAMLSMVVTELVPDALGLAENPQ